MKISIGIKNILRYQIPFILSSGLPILTLPIFTRYLSLDDYGLISLANIYGILVVGICNFGLVTAFERNFFESKGTSEKISLLWTCVLSVFSFLVVVFFLTYLFQKKISDSIFTITLPSYLLLFSLLNLGVKSLIQYFYVYFKNSEDSYNYVRITVFESILSTGLALYFVVYDSLGIIGYVFGQAMGVSIVFFFLVMLFILKKGISFNIIQLKSSIRLGAPLIPRIFFGVINGQFDRYMIGILANIGSLGIYDIAQKIANTSFNFMASIEKVYSPKIFKLYFNSREEFNENSGVILLPFFYVIYLFCLLVGLFSEELLFILTTSEFHTAYPLIIPLVMIYGIYFFGTTGQLLLAKKTKLISKLSLGALFLNIIFNYPMIKYYGATGASWATFVSGLTISMVTFYFSQKHTKINYPTHFIWAVLLFLIGLMTTSILFQLNFSYQFRLLFKLINVIAFLFLCYKMSVFEIISGLLKKNEL
tara:strand:+ start:4086 stop:5519 length:1434 start_codon:yes stop_codon:yes gene_type:complete